MPRKLTGRIEPRPNKLNPTHWVVRLGKGKDCYVGTYTSLVEAQFALKDALAERRERAHKRSVAALWAIYMDQCEQAQRGRRGDAEQFARERSITRHVAGASWYRKLVDKVTHDDVRELMGQVVGAPAMRWHRGKGELVRSGKKIGNRTGEQLRSRLRDFFRWVSKPTLPYNPAIGIKLPNPAPAERPLDGDLKPHYHADELARLWALPLETLSLRDRAVFGFGIYAGLRPGEIKGLEWQHLARLYGERPTIHVRRSFHRLPKTEESQRDIPMLPQLVELVRAYVESLPARPVSGLVFPSPAGEGGAGKCFSRTWDCGWKKHIRKAAGMRPHLKFCHMRHTFGSHMVRGTFTGGRPWSIEAVAQAMGHKSTTTTKKHYVSRDVELLHRELALSLGGSK